MIQGLQDKWTLRDGTKMPGFGLGCYDSQKGQMYQGVAAALELGYQLIDTATRYENEKEVGQAVRDSGKKREDIFVVSKLWPTLFHKPEAGVEYSLKALNLEYIDMYLLHWPGLDENARYRAYETLLRYQEKGFIKSIGVSNFLIHHLEGLKKAVGRLPLLNQIELHPWYPQLEIKEYCQNNQIAVEGWAPIFRGAPDKEPLLIALSEKYQKTPAQVTLRWHIQQGHIVIPKSSKKERIRQNSEIFDFQIADSDMEKINSLANGNHAGADPDQFDGQPFHINL